MPTYTASARGTANFTITAPAATVYSASARGTANFTITAPGTSGGETVLVASDRGTASFSITAPKTYHMWQFVDGIKYPVNVVTTPPDVTAGALTRTAYEIPTTAPTIYVDPVNGSNTNSGSILAPRKTVASASESIKAFGNASAPGTVILRAGTYHEGSYNPGDGYFLRWQAYPNEIATFDGSSVFTGSWTNNGNGTWTTSYAAPGIPSLGTDKIGDDPNALLPDMCFVDGVELYQTADGTTPSSGQFSVNRTSNTLTIAQNPAGHEVRYSDLVYLLTSGSKLDILGVDVRRYRCAGNTLNAGLYYGGVSDDTIIENVKFTQMGRNCLSVSDDRTRISRCSFLKIGQTAILGGPGNALANGPLDDLIIERCYIDETDTGKWKTQPTSGAIKLTATRRTILRNNRMLHSHVGNQMWLDVSCSQVDIFGNFIDGASLDGTTYADSGICYEECDGGYWGGVQYKSRIVGNTVINCHKSVVICASGNVIVANNVIHAKWTATTAQAVLVLQDRDTNHGGQVPAANVQWWCAGVEILNNYILVQDSGWQLLAYDSQGEVPRPRAVAAGLGSATGQQTGGFMLARVEGNCFAPAGGTQATGIMASIGQANGNRINLNTPAALATTNATYGLSSTNIGTNFQQATPPTGTDHNNARPIDSRYASILKLPVGTRFVGNPLTTPVLETK